MELYFVIVVVVVGFWAAKFFAGKKTGVQGRLKSLRIHVGRRTIHFHHWLIACIALIALVLADYHSGFIYGFLMGLVIQGLTYRDFYKIVYQREN